MWMKSARRLSDERRPRFHTAAVSEHPPGRWFAHRRPGRLAHWAPCGGSPTVRTTSRHRPTGSRRTNATTSRRSASPSGATSTSPGGGPPSRRSRPCSTWTALLRRSPGSRSAIATAARPYVQLDGEQAAVDVSMSDRSGWAVCLVGPPGTMASGTVGIDLEMVEPRSARFVEDYFTAAERDYVRRPPGRSTRRSGEPHLVGEGSRAEGAAGRAPRRHPNRRGRTRPRPSDRRLVGDDRDGTRRADARLVATVGRVPAHHRIRRARRSAGAARHEQRPRHRDPRHSWVQSPTC